MKSYYPSILSFLCLQIIFALWIWHSFCFFPVPIFSLGVEIGNTCMSSIVQRFISKDDGASYCSLMTPARFNKMQSFFLSMIFLNCSEPVIWKCVNVSTISRFFFLWLKTSKYSLFLMMSMSTLLCAIQYAVDQKINALQLNLIIVRFYENSTTNSKKR